MNRKNCLAIVVSIGLLMFVECGNKPNDKLKIEGKTYSISLGEIKYDTDNGLISIAVLANGQPLQNKIEHRSSIINIDGQQVMTNVSSNPLVKMTLMTKGRIKFANEAILSEDGIFTFEVEEMPDIIKVYTNLKKRKSNVSFNAKTKELMSSKEHDLYDQEWIRINRKELGID